MSRHCLFWLIASTLLVCAGRFAVPSHGLSLPGTYEAFVHIWVGVMLLLIFLTLPWCENTVLYLLDNRRSIMWLSFSCLLAATVLEGVMFARFVMK